MSLTRTPASACLSLAFAETGRLQTTPDGEKWTERSTDPLSAFGDADEGISTKADGSVCSQSQQDRTLTPGVQRGMSQAKTRGACTRGSCKKVIFVTIIPSSQSSRYSIRPDAVQARLS